MKLPAVSVVCLVLFVISGAARVESARGALSNWYSLFVFGDSFADNGNLPRTEHESEWSRQWYYPYGLSYTSDDGSGPRSIPTGRFSDNMVQSDFVAKILGLHESPPAYEYTGNIACDYSGMNFAVGGSGVHEVPQGVPTLGMQVDNFERLINRGIITSAHLSNSIALVAVSGNDYARVGVADTSSFSDITGFIANVTTEMLAIVERLQALGVKKVLVNNLHPMGCTPSQTRANKYAACDGGGNMGTSVHNNNLQQLLGEKENVFIVDLNVAFTNIVNNAHGDEGSEQLKHKLAPCCRSIDPKGYCGQVGESWENSRGWEYLYYLCDKSEERFYWDDMHPTHAGWAAVMKQLEDPIKDFLAAQD